ncbi:hypothetical protein K432DRAFT_473031 [Lepidopterella palustris CBS 459.81]|uniref:Serine/threonine-protein kinase MEC1 n=1 Tax=Lepidopterella palustris CBS 459.81 TaxID=1314670 RepID=A0A8E2JH20_9PEZI|nr:hypothetical protein K432DRAFT_473031 [Lepidopterella palustris CBS 459.81]
MARRGGESVQRLMTVAVANDSVPPSTIAAQIVNNHSNVNAQQEPRTKAVFGQLLQEYLSDPSNDEPNSQLNAQLISVVTEAGLDALLYENPFAPDLLIPQAIASIAVIKLTIQRRPELLLNTKTDEGDGITRPKLFLWLLPKLLPLMGHQHYEAIQEHLRDLLLSCVQILQCTSDLWQHAVSFTKLYRSCHEEIQNEQTRRMKCFTTLIGDYLEPSVSAICHNLTWLNSLIKDLQLVVCLFTVGNEWPTEVNALRSSLCSLSSPIFDDQDLELTTSPLLKRFREENLPDQDRPQKRQRVQENVGVGDDLKLYNSIISVLSDTLFNQRQPDISGLNETIGVRYSQLSEEKQCALFSDRCLGKLACAGSHSLENTDSHNRQWEELSCKICDMPHTNQDRDPQTYWNAAHHGEDWKTVISVLAAVTENSDFQRSVKPRILLTLTIRRVFNHISEAESLDLSLSLLGQWCLRSLRSSSRELRIAAGRALAVFLRSDVPKDVQKKNRVAALDFFRNLADRNLLPEQETLILAFGQAARVCGEEALNIILISLIDYLGHPNPLICGIAYHELSCLAEALNKTPLDLLRPFWRNIGITVIQDLQTRPQKAQQLCDLLGLSVNQLLVMTQTETVPYLVLTKKRGVLQRITTACAIAERRPNMQIQDLCTQPRNLAAILALLLYQSSGDVEKTAMDTLVEVAPAFQENGNDLSSWVKLEPVLVACELLKALAEQDITKKPQIHRAIQHLAILAEGKSAHAKTPPKKNKSLVPFFESHVLGIMAHFSDVLDSPLGTHSVSERRRCVGAIGEMINLAKAHVSIALPQLRACLQSAVEDKQLCDQTFEVWATLLTVVDGEDIGSLIDHMFAIIAQNWSSFSEETQHKAYDTVGILIKTHSSLLRERIDFLPSLASIPLMSKYDGEISRFKSKVELGNHFDTFSQRCCDENAVVVTRALKELVPFLEMNQNFLHDSAISQKPTRVLSQLTRSILDACVRFTEDHSDITVLCAQCLGLIGCLDPHRLEAVREKRDILVLSNFERAVEVIDFSAFLLEQILVKVFHSTTNARAQGFLAYVMQELLKFCGFNEIAAHRPRFSQSTPTYQRWMEIPESVRSTLTPLLSSRYMIKRNKEMEDPLPTYPLFSQDSNHGNWLRTFVFDLLQKKAKGQNAELIFPVLAKIIKGHDLSIANFILPFAVLNVIVGGTDEAIADVGQELLTVLESEIIEGDHVEAENIKHCSENIFQVLDYLSRWLQEKRNSVSEARAMAGRTGKAILNDDIKDVAQISSVERIIQSIPAEVISRRAVECGSYARALFHWEQYIRQEREKAEASKATFERDLLFQRLQYIYAQIDEPDSIEGISAHLRVLDPNQQVLEHRKAGRWTAAQSWYELSLADKPDDPDIQIDLLTCLKESGQYDSLLNYVEGFRNSSTSCTPKLLPFAAEAAWVTGKWQKLEKILETPAEVLSQVSQEFNVGIGKALLALRRKDKDDFLATIASLREGVARGLSPTATASLQACHDHLLKLHVLYEIEAISGLSKSTIADRDAILANLDRRLDVLGAYTSDKQYLLGIRRATMQLSSLNFTKLDIASAWLTSARLARKANFTTTAFNSVLHAAQLGDDAAKIEHSRLLWKDGHHRKAIQNLEGAITGNSFKSSDIEPIENSMITTADQLSSQNKLTARAHLLLAKWLDRAGQTKSDLLKEKYSTGVIACSKWDKGHYYLGRHYNKILESEKSLPRNKQSLAFLYGETAKLVIENYTRSMVYGSKYYYQTVPKVLTLWLDLGMEVHTASQRPHIDQDLNTQRSRYLEAIHKHLRKYMTERLPAYTWYTAFPQIITRISHPNKNVYDVLSAIIIKVAAKYPQQALWSLLAVPKATAKDRATRGLALLMKLKEHSKRNKSDPTLPDLKALITHGQRLSDALLAACEVPVDGRTAHVSLQKDLGFNHKLAPCALVVPIESTMIASLPAGQDSRAIRNHNPFPHDAITIASFTDDVLVLSSLQRPRKLNVRGTDGRLYGLLCKPKDDLRKDQRLMEFNAMINRALQRDIESSKRRLYIKTYSVTPLNEECGTIEWVEGLKPMRDIIIRLYRQKNVPIDYGELRNLLTEACSDLSKVSIFTERILKKFPPVLYEWFIETFPEPEAWFAARLRYTRSCAVMSIVGHVLGLGDRHGENVLLEEGNGGIFHVDFNCLFDKGLTFEKPELVPFRLTHNMVDAMGPCSIEGPFRTAAELVYAQLRTHEDTLITILETFVHDPTADFLGGGEGKKRKKRVEGVPETPQEVLESVRGKVGGLLRGESVPLSVEGYVDALVAMAMDPRCLSAMYIGWCAFF